MPSNRLTPLDFSTQAIELKTGTFTTRWEQLLRALFGDVAAVASLPAIINRFAFAAQPALGASDENYLAFVTDYGHLVRWTGTVWEFGPGDVGNGFFRDFAFVPQEAGWKLCDGSATDYLVVGAATLTVAAITPPNLSGFYRKGAAAYDAVLHAKSGGTDVGVTADGATTQSPDEFFVPAAGLTHTTSTYNHRHDIAGLAIPSLGVGTIEMAHVDVLPYFRR